MRLFCFPYILMSFSAVHMDLLDSLYHTYHVILEFSFRVIRIIILPIIFEQSRDYAILRTKVFSTAVAANVV